MTINQIAEAHGKRVNNLWHFDDIALSIFANKVRGIEQSVEPVANKWETFVCYLIDHCEGEVITEEGLQRLLMKMLNNPAYTPNHSAPDVSLLTDDEINAQAAKHQLSTTEERHWYGDNYTVSVNNIKGANDFAKAIEQLVLQKAGLK